MKDSTFTIKVAIIILLIFLLLGGISYLLMSPNVIKRTEEGFNYDMTLEERIQFANNIPKKHWILAREYDDLYFKGKANADKIHLQLTEPFEINSDYEVLTENGAERVLLLETSLEEGGVKPIRYVYDFDTIEPGTYRLNISSEYDYKITLRRKREP